MLEMFGMLMFIAFAALLIGAAAVIAIFAKIVSSQGGAVGFFVVATVFLCVLGIAIAVAGFIPT